MRDEEAHNVPVMLEARVWTLSGQDRVLVAQRLRRPDGEITMTWFVPPASLLDVLWVEWLVEDQGDPSAS
jgi:hypothetical protein